MRWENDIRPPGGAKKANITVLFYTTTPRAFRSTSIAHLYEISRQYRVVLLSEELDEETNRLLQDASLFPGLADIVPIHQYAGRTGGLFRHHAYLCKASRAVVEKYAPAVVVSSSDMHSIFELYLMRHSRERGNLNICIQDTLQARETKWSALWVDLHHAHTNLPVWLPMDVRRSLIEGRKYLGHLLYYWILPMAVGQKPFHGRSSHILRVGNAGMRDADFSVVFSNRDYASHVRDGVSAQKLYKLSHPLQREATRAFFKRTLLKTDKALQAGRPAVTLLLPPESIGFKKDTYRLISREQKRQRRQKMVRMVAETLPAWDIFIKPHPDTPREDLGVFTAISDRVHILDPSESLEKFMEMSEAVIGLPRSASHALFSASLQCPEKPILSLDFDKEFLGDLFKDFPGIDYLDSEERFIQVLEEIRGGLYRKNSLPVVESDGFSSAVAMIESLWEKKFHEIH